MNQEPTNLRALRNLLREIADLAEHASLTGSLAGGAPKAAARYNAVLERVAPPDGLFAPIDPAGAEFAAVAIEARMLAAFLDSERKGASGQEGFDPGVLMRLAPFVKSEDLAQLVREQSEAGTRFDPNTLTALAPFLDSETLGKLVRDLMGARRGAPSPPSPPSAPAAASSRDLAIPSAEEASDSLDRLASELRRPDLIAEERSRIAIRLAEIAHATAPE